jgi:hypothetical protein
MINIGSNVYQIVKRGETRFFIRNNVGVDVEKDTDATLTTLSDFVMEFKNCKECSVIGEWFLKKGGKDVV